MTPFIRLRPKDDVLIARAQLVSGTFVEGIPVDGLIPPGRKIATHATVAGDPLRRYNQIIGFASRAIAAGEHVHTHNLDMGPNKGDFERDYAFGADVKPEPAKREACSAAHITIGLQCGGSAGYSGGISANPARGAAVDLLVAHGGSAILSETPEIYGAAHVLTRRAVT